MDWSSKIDDAVDYIEQNITTELNVNDIADYSHISRSHFNKVFKKLMGMTVYEYILKRKITLASYDLIKTNDKIIDIASKYGYDHDTFTRAFKRENNITPQKFRKEGKIRNEYPRLYSYNKDNSFEELINTTEILDSKIVEKRDLHFIGILQDDTYFNNDYIIARNFDNNNLNLISETSGVDLIDKYKIRYPLNNNGLYKLMNGNIFNPLEEYTQNFEELIIPHSTWVVFKAYNEFNYTFCEDYIFSNLNKLLNDINIKYNDFTINNSYCISFNNSYKNVDDYLMGTIRGFYSEVWIQIERK